MLEICSKNNKIFKKLKKLSSNGLFRKKEELTILDGEHLIESAIQSRIKINALFFVDENKHKFYKKIFTKLDKTPKYRIPVKLMHEISLLKSSPGILALIDTPKPSKKAPRNLILFLDQIQDPGNLGSILRSAQAFNVKSIFMSPGCADLWSPKTLRGSQGAQFKISCHENQDLIMIIKKYKLPTFLLDTYGKSISSMELTKDMAIVIGNEGSGIRLELQNFVKDRISIPMSNSVESLNVVSAASIMMYEYNRQFR